MSYPSIEAFIEDPKILTLVDQGLVGMEDGELFVEDASLHCFSLDDGILKNASQNYSQGFGLRSVLGERYGYAQSSTLSLAKLEKACDTVQAVKKGFEGQVVLDQNPLRSNHRYYQAEDTLPEKDVADRVALLKGIDQYLRKKDPRVVQVSASIVNSMQDVTIVRPGGFIVRDSRPLVRLNISVVMQQGERMENGSYGTGGRFDASDFFKEEVYQKAADKAFKQAEVNLQARPAPAGEMTVVLGPGWPGVLLHEAVGHGLEGDFNRKGTSAFSGKIGEQVAAKGVTVVDDGTIQDRRGSLNVDDEGTATSETVLIEDGILKGYMHDRMNARLMGHTPTGNGRRESYAHVPMPRMTNTFMRAGNQSQEEIIQSVKRGIFATNFGGGQVDITSGKFVFSASEAYMIEDGKVSYPIKGATLIGNGPDVMQKITMIGNDLALDEGIGTCGKAGQGVPVGVGQPSLRIDGITVGGTELT